MTLDQHGGGAASRCWAWAVPLGCLQLALLPLSRTIFQEKGKHGRADRSSIRSSDIDDIHRQGSQCIPMLTAETRCGGAAAPATPRGRQTLAHAAAALNTRPETFRRCVSKQPRSCLTSGEQRAAERHGKGPRRGRQRRQEAVRVQRRDRKARVAGQPPALRRSVCQLPRQVRLQPCVSKPFRRIRAVERPCSPVFFCMCASRLPLPLRCARRGPHRRDICKRAGNWLPSPSPRQGTASCCNEQRGVGRSVGRKRELQEAAKAE